MFVTIMMQFYLIIFSYQIKDGKVGFPLKTLDKVLFDLRERKVSVVIFDDGLIVEKRIEDNQYNRLLEVAIKYDFETKMNNLLLQKISYLIQGNTDNYNKIKEFVDEL